MLNDILIEAKKVAMYFPLTKGIIRQRKIAEIKAVDGVDLAIRRGETLGLVGESGCGKTTLGRCFLQLLRPTSGEVFFEKVDLCLLGDNQLRPVRQGMQIIFQDPFDSLDPRMTAEEIVAEPLRVHTKMRGRELKDKVADLLRIVGLNPSMAERYPHEFSGGQRQRLGIARALSIRPKFIVCDEPISALDVSIQAQIINLLEDLQGEFNLTYLFIAHDLSVVRHISHRVAVMYLGKIVEIANRDDLYQFAQHPYTKALLSAVPIPDPAVEALRERIILGGEPPSPMALPAGCNFNPRCSIGIDLCQQEVPPLHQAGRDHWVACHRA
ncbi:MAG: ATP-binding cassette domain-containing protein [Thermodesulfobacteriota bacterium]|nr:ATP-binding cassette domain-containing protein [Thermodesulfobacteriota bacterium]